MEMTLEEFREGLRNGTVVFCLPAAHAELSNDFLDDFSARVLKQDWRDVMVACRSRAPSLLMGDVSEAEMIAEIDELYGVDVSDLDGLPLWDVVQRCAKAVS
jgi:hypothetical protein